MTADESAPMSKAETQARERLANNGRNTANGNRGIKVGSDLHLCEMLLGELDAARGKLDALSALKSDTKPLVDFVRWAIQEGSWVGADIPGDVVQDKAEELGLITRTKYDPKIHGESDIADPGDDWYVFGPLIADQKQETT